MLLLLFSSHVGGEYHYHLSRDISRLKIWSSFSLPSPCCFFLRWLSLRLWTFKFLCTPFSYFSLSLFLHFLLLFFFLKIFPYLITLSSLTLYKPLFLFIFQYYPLVYLLLGGGKTLCLFWSLFSFLIFISLTNFFCFFLKKVLVKLVESRRDWAFQLL